MVYAKRTGKGLSLITCIPEYLRKLSDDVLFYAVFFLIGEVFALYLALHWQRRSQSISVRSDVWGWLSGRSALTGESTDHIAERAISLYRLRLEGGPQGVPSVPEPAAVGARFRAGS